MPKIITAKRLESEAGLAKDYVKTHILFSSTLLGLILLVAGAGSLIYQFMFEAYGWQTVVESTVLLVLGAAVGWGQTKYHRYLLREHPWFFAGRMKAFSRSGQKRKKDGPNAELQHPGRNLVPLYYLLGIVGLLGAAAASAMFGHVYYMAALLMPWAGFFWARMYFWRDVIALER